MKSQGKHIKKLFELFRSSQIGSLDVRHYAAASTKLIEIGRLQNRVGENYESGQLFLHKVFGYRGIILFPWTAKLYDYDAYYKKDSAQNPSSKNDGSSFFPMSGGHNPKPATPANIEPNATQTNYQVLIDERDWPYMRVHKDDVCILQKTSIGRMTLLPLSGFSQTAHEDIMPYASSEAEPFKHNYFEQFFDVTQSEGWHMKQNAALQAWRNRCLPYLKFSGVYRRTTHDVRVTVIPYYLGYGLESHETMGSELQDRNKSYVWRYSIRLENFGDERVVLREREWEIVDVYGRKEIHKGRGVIGTEPHLSKTEPAFQYSSFMYLRAPRGHMSGAYIMQREDGTLFRCTIPQFELDSLPSAEDDIL